MNLQREDSQPGMDGQAVDMGSQEVVIPALISAGWLDTVEAIFPGSRRWKER